MFSYVESEEVLILLASTHDITYKELFELANKHKTMADEAMERLNEVK